MRVTETEIRLAYRLLLDRTPSEEEIAQLNEQLEDMSSLRRAFLKSDEFERKYAQLTTPVEANSRPTLIHLHIPKTAGTSLSSIVADSFPEQERLGLSTQEIDTLRQMPLEQRARLGFIFGHLSHGIGDDLTQDTVYICTLRRPGPRIFSYYRYIKRREDHPIHELVAGADMSFGDFLEFCATDPPQRLEADNGQIRRLANRMDFNSLGKEHEVLQTALGNVFAPNMIFGLTERFGEFLDRLVARGVIKAYRPITANAAPDVMPFDDVRAELTSEQHVLLDTFTRWDDLFYDICESYLFGLDQEGKSPP